MKNIELKHVVLFALFLILVVPVFNTSSLYGDISTLKDHTEKEIARYFLGFTFEFCIFLCVYAGYRPAGVFFAFVSLFIGLLFHIQFKDVRHIDNWYEHKFISSVVIQIGISSLVYFLSELYVSIIRKQEALLKLAELSSRIAELDSIKSPLEQEVSELEQKLKLLTKEEGSQKFRIAELKENENIIEQAIVSLQKKKAGLSTKKQNRKTA
jgi:hypothetical protein